MVNRTNKAAAGFTLLELMLAIGILSVVLAMLAGSFNVVSHGKIHAESRLEANQTGRAIMWQMGAEIRGATLAIPGAAATPRTLLIGTGHMQRGAPLDSLTICTAGAGHRRSAFGFSSEDLVSYSTQSNPAHPGWFLLVRKQQSALLPDQGGPQIQSVVLADNLISLHIRYFNGEIWNESWNSQTVAQSPSAASQIPLPQAIEIELQTGARQGPPTHFSTQIALPMANLQR